MAQANDSTGANSTTTTTSGVHGVNSPTLTEQSFRQREAKIRAITELREGQFDVNAACTRLIGALPGIKKMRPLIEETFRNFDLETFDDLEPRLHAAHYCNALWLSKANNKVSVAELAAALDEWIPKLTETCEMLVSFHKVAPEQLASLGKEGGYGGKVNDVTTLLGVLRRIDAPTLARTMVNTADLTAVEVALLTFQSALGKRQVAPVEREEASLLRQQAITYMLQSFDLALKAALYLHGETVGRQMVPSPYADRGNRKSKLSEGAPAPDVEAESKDTTPVTPGTFVVTNSTGLPLTSPFENDGTK